MSNLDTLMDTIAEKTDGREGHVLYSLVDMKYAFGQVSLDESTVKPCNFQIEGRKSTCTNQFVTGRYGLSFLPTEFPKLIDITVVNMDCTFVYINGF